MTSKNDEDNYKPEGVVTLVVDRFSDFARGINGPNGESAQRLSAPVYIRGLPWKILAIPREISTRNPMQRRAIETGDEPSRCLGFFLQCNGEVTDTTWTCTATATLTVASQKEGVDDHTRKISHHFNAKENDWGYSQFMNCDVLLDPSNGYIDNDTVVLSASVCADAPHGVHWDSKKHAGHIGLKNQGATCYMNSILQTLFFTNKLRKAVYMMPTEDDDPESSVALAMQRVFYELQFSEVPVGTKKLTKSFGWDSLDSFLQHDVQELCRVLLDNLESKMKSTVVAGTIPELFEGRMKSYIKCKEVEFESSREESFYDVQLNVKGKSNVIDSFRDYTNPETLDGDNKYDAGVHGLQRAEKGVKFISFPPVLHLQLMRFQYDPALDANVKINDRFEFSDELKLDEFIDEHTNKPDDYTYLLHAVLVHTGDFHGGHYVVFINTNLNGNQRWCKFDDDVVSRAAVRDAVAANFGGEDPEVMNRVFTNAYMLVYVKKSAVNDVLCDVSETDIPEHLRIRFENEKKRDIQRKREKEEATLYCEISIITDEDLKAHTGFDLYDAKEVEQHPNKMKVEKSMSISEFYSFVGRNLKLKQDQFRLWCFGDYLSDRYNFAVKRDYYAHEIIRPKFLLKSDDNAMSEHNGFGQSDFFENDQVLYLETAKLNPTTMEFELPPYDPEVDYLFFLKFYNPERNATEYKGTLFLNAGRDLASHLPQINALLNFPALTELTLYTEFRPDIVFMCRLSMLPRDESRFGDGGILIAEVADQVDSDRNAHTYFKNLFNRIEAEAFINLEGFGTNVDGTNSVTNAPPIRGAIGLDWTVKRVAEWIGHEISFDPARILLWKVSQHNEKPTNFVVDNTISARDLLSLNNHNVYDPRAGRCYKLFYSKLPIPVAELENRRHIRILALYDKFQTAELSIFPEKTGTVQNLLDEAARDFKFSENGTKQLRLVHMSTTTNCLRVFQLFHNNTPLSELNSRIVNSFVQFRVEEIPHDQLEIASDEFLLPVGHFDKEPTRMFGVPFFIKVTDGEKISNIRQRIKEMLDVPDREFEKYKFCIVMNGRAVRELDAEDDNAVVNLAEIMATHITTPPAAPFLGIDHMNKSRGMRGGHTAEKAIVIHN